MKLSVLDLAPVTSASNVALAAANHALSYTALGNAEQVKRKIEQFSKDTAVNEVMLTCHAYDHAARKRSFAIAAEAFL